MKTEQEQFDLKILVCRECREEFVFTAAAQQYFSEQGLDPDPEFCKPCNAQRRRSSRDFTNASAH